MIEEPKKVDLLNDWDDLSFEEKSQAIKETVTVVEVAELMGLEIDSSDKITSPFNPTESTPSCHLYDDHFYDYSTGRWGDVFDLVKAFYPDTTFPQALWDIRMRALKSGKEVGDVELQKPRQVQDFTADLADFPIVSNGNLYIDWHFWVREDAQGNLYVPHRDQDGVYGVKVRWKTGGKGSWAGSAFTHRLYDPFGWQPGWQPSGTVVITEGESDAWALIWATARSVDVLALPSGSSSWKDHWLDDLTCYDRVLLCMDNDRAGKQALDKLLLKVGYSRAEPLRVPQLYNDAREAVEAGWRPEVTS